ncbi:MAG TPA: sortase [Candidatus Saccharimonadales bacterium]|nr:sortase [Candidatus Saccharimonadales bacterium]
MKLLKRPETRFYLVVGLFFIVAGLLLGSPHLIQQWQNSNSQPIFAEGIAHAESAKKATISGTPSHIDIPAVNISVDIEPGYYNKTSQTWTLSLTKAEYATVTPPANNGGGNTFIYGHNRWAVFYKLLKVQDGDEAIVTTSNHHTFVYKMTGRHDTSPNDTSLFHYQGPPILTLQTCSGMWYQNRSLFVFKLVKAY